MQCHLQTLLSENVKNFLILLARTISLHAGQIIILPKTRRQIYLEQFLFCSLLFSLFVNFIFLSRGKTNLFTLNKDRKSLFLRIFAKKYNRYEFTKLVIIQISYTCRHFIDIQHSQEESAYKKLLRFMPFRVHQLKIIQTIVDTFK